MAIFQWRIYQNRSEIRQNRHTLKLNLNYILIILLSALQYRSFLVNNGEIDTPQLGRQGRQGKDC